MHTVSFKTKVDKKSNSTFLFFYFVVFKSLSKLWDQQEALVLRFRETYSKTGGKKLQKQGKEMTF